MLVEDPKSFAGNLRERTRRDYPRLATVFQFNRGRKSANPPRPPKLAFAEFPILRGLEKENTSQISVLFYVNNSLPYTQSGYTIRSQATLEALAKIGVNCFAATRLGYPVTVGKMPECLEELVDGVQYRRLIPWRNKRDTRGKLEQAVGCLTEAAKECKANILHTTTDFNNAVVVSRAAATLKIPWIYEIRGEPHNTWISRLPSDQQAAARLSRFYTVSQCKELEAVKSATAVITISELTRDALISHGISADKIFVAPNALNDSEIAEPGLIPADRANFVRADGYLVGIVSSLVDYEGIDVLLRAVALDADLNCLIVGDGVARPRLESLASELGILDRVTFVGEVPHCDIARWYATLDVFVLPRRNLTVCRNVTPLKALRAQALSVPVVASDLPAIREVTGNHAIYVAPDDPVALRHGIERALNLRDNQDVSRARRWALTRTWANNARTYLNAYRYAGATGSND